MYDNWHASRWSICSGTTPVQEHQGCIWRGVEKGIPALSRPGSFVSAYYGGNCASQSERPRRGFSIRACSTHNRAPSNLTVSVLSCTSTYHYQLYTHTYKITNSKYMIWTKLQFYRGQRSTPFTAMWKKITARSMHTRTHTILSKKNAIFVHFPSVFVCFISEFNGVPLPFDEFLISCIHPQHQASLINYLVFCFGRFLILSFVAILVRVTDKLSWK